MEDFDVGVTVSSESGDSRVTLSVANYKQTPVAIRFTQPLGDHISHSQVSFCSDATDDWKLTEEHVVFTDMISWASNISRSYVLEDVSQSTIEHVLSKSTIEIRDRDGRELGTQTGIDAEYETQRTPSATPPRASGRDSVTGDGTNQNTDDENELIGERTTETARDTTRSSPDDTRDETGNSSHLSPGPDTTDTRDDTDTAQTAVGHNVSESTIEVGTAEHEESQMEPDPRYKEDDAEDSETNEDESTQETRPNLPTIPQSYVLQDVADDIDSADFSWATEASETPSSNDDSEGLFAKLRSWL